MFPVTQKAISNASTTVIKDAGPVLAKLVKSLVTDGAWVNAVDDKLTDEGLTLHALCRQYYLTKDKDRRTLNDYVSIPF